MILDVPKGEFPPHKMSFRELSMILLGGLVFMILTSTFHMFFFPQKKNGETNKCPADQAHHGNHVVSLNSAHF